MIVRFFAYIRNYTNTRETTVSQCQTVEELLEKLISRYGEKFKDKVYKNGSLSDEIIILVNGRHITHLDTIKTRLTDTDVISIFPVVAGG